MPNYTDTTKPQLTAAYFGIRRTGKDVGCWEVEVREVEYANLPDLAEGAPDFQRNAGGFSFQINPDKLGEEFPLIDPETLEPTKEMATYAQLFALVQSCYMHEARKRDKAAAENVEK